MQLGGSEERYLDTITDADNRRSLLNRLAELGDIKHPDGHVYHVVDMLDIIRRLKGVDDPNLLKVTRTYGLRDKVSFILEKEQLE